MLHSGPTPGRGGTHLARQAETVTPGQLRDTLLRVITEQHDPRDLDVFYPSKYEPDGEPVVIVLPVSGAAIRRVDIDQVFAVIDGTGIHFYKTDQGYVTHALTQANREGKLPLTEMIEKIATPIFEDRNLDRGAEDVLLMAKKRGEWLLFRRKLARIRIMDLSRVWVVIPAYNEEEKIGTVVDDLQNHGFVNLVVINDGSQDRTAVIAREKGCVVVSHAINCGLGAALSTGFAYLKKRVPEKLLAAVTFDADGQHLAEDALKVVGPVLREEADFVVGSRLLRNQAGMPIMRVVGNKLINLLIFLFWRIKTTDSQSGLRGFSRQAVDLIEIRATGYSVSSEFFREAAANRLRYIEVSISTIYSAHSLSKGQNVSHAIDTVRSLMMQK